MNPYQSAVIAIMTILAPKLLIDLRIEYSGAVPLSGKSTLETMEFTGISAVPQRAFSSESSSERPGVGESRTESYGATF